MKRIEAILRVERLRIVKEHLKEIGIGGIIIHVSGRLGNRRPKRKTNRASKRNQR
jgi:nitrogen regulatory protein PII